MKKINFSQKIWQFIREGKEIPKMCFICGEDDPRILRKCEDHHIFGKFNLDFTILLCPNCHAKITATQNSIAPKKRTKFASRNEKIGFMLVSYGKLMELIAKKSQEIGFELIKNG